MITGLSPNTLCVLVAWELPVQLLVPAEVSLSKAMNLLQRDWPFALTPLHHVFISGPMCIGPVCVYLPSYPPPSLWEERKSSWTPAGLSVCFHNQLVMKRPTLELNRWLPYLFLENTPCRRAANHASGAWEHQSEGDASCTATIRPFSRCGTPVPIRRLPSLSGEVGGSAARRINLWRRSSAPTPQYHG